MIRRIFYSILVFGAYLFAYISHGFDWLASKTLTHKMIMEDHFRDYRIRHFDNKIQEAIEDIFPGMIQEK